MSIDAFIDSNIFVYLFDSTNPNKRYRAERLIADALQMGNTCISYQVVQETLNVITTKRPSCVSMPRLNRPVHF